MGASNDGSEDVDQFLARIASLSKKSEDDAEQARRAEEQMMQARKERQARRAERARSISPVKTGPAAPLSTMSPQTTEAQRSIDPPVSLTPLSRARTGSRLSESPNRSGRPLPSPTREQERPLPPPPLEKPETLSFSSSGARPLSRSGTLSWQQRPLSRGIGSVRSRPLSASRGGSAEPPSSPAPPAQNDTEDPPSRKDIAAALGSKDPTWFRQTQDRGLGSAAYRKSEQSDSDTPAKSQQGMRLPGLSADNKTERTATDSLHVRSPRFSSDEQVAAKQPLGSTSPRRNNAASAYVSNPGPAPALSPTEPPTMLQPSSEVRNLQDLDSGVARAPSMLSSAGRPPSPTKGLGGFVQSAMMRRSDSVSKRWSVQANAGLKRGDSVAGSRPAFNAPTANVPPLGHARTLSREPRSARDGTASPQPSSRPTSSHADEQTQSTMQKSQSEPQGLVAPASNRASVASQPPALDTHDDSLLSRSPSKTMDPRRWSPTKASWLESALARPESPRFSPTKEEPPAWKVGLQRSKSQKELANTEKEPGTSDRDARKLPVRETKPIAKESLSKPNGYFKAVDHMASTDKEPQEGKQPVANAETAPESLAEPFAEPVAKPVKGVTSPPEFLNAAKPRKDEDKTKKDAEEQPLSTASFRESVDKKPPVLKPKPQTPPKTDFRANLKTRQTGPTSANSDEPEFRSVFGKLKKAETKNYVAPDTLKDNITRGKAGLSLTGGPQPRKRVDEFKESILAQKDAMKAGGGSIHAKLPSRDESPEKSAVELPEALRRRNTLHKSKASTEISATNEQSKSTSTNFPPSAKSSAISNSEKDSQIGARARVPPSKPAEKPLFTSAAKKEEAPSVSEPDIVDKARIPTPDSVVKAEPTVSAKKETSRPAERTTSRTSTQTSGTSTTIPGQELERILSRTTTAASDTSSRGAPISGRASPALGASLQSKKGAGGIAARLNPALAGLIARGNSPKPAMDESQQGASTASDTVQRPKTSTGKAEDPVNLTHMTKARAKGPKRRAPKAEGAPTQSEVPKAAPIKTAIPNTTTTETVGSASPARSPVKASFADVRNAFDTKSPSKKDELISKPEKHPLPQSLDKPSEAKSPPPVQSKSPELKTASRQSPSLGAKLNSPPVVASKSPEVRRISSQTSAPEKTEDTPPKPPVKKTFDIATDRTSKDAGSPKPIAPLPLTPSRSKLNSPRPQKPSDDAVDSPLASKANTPGLGLSLGGVVTTPSKASHLTPPPEGAHRSSAPAERRQASENASPPRRALETFFSTVPRSDETAEFDTEAILKGGASASERVKTLNSQVFEVSGDGKRTALSPGQEHVLFEECMYLVLHNFELAGKKTTEAYLWMGDAVAASAGDDVQLFCRKIARENSAKLDVVKQGKESSNFFSAVGGILIIRRSKASALYMLRGQRHVGHVVFDEVDPSAEALCSGFPYLISAKFGKLYLWKGQGCGADEVGAARLIGMDIGLTGEIEEVAEGKEPAAFWDCFPGPNAKATFKPSEIWAMRSMDEKKGFPCKLYRLEAERPKSSGGFWGLRATSPSKPSNKATLTEITPFTQQDLDKDSVHVLDAWASVYVIPGSQSKPADFATALHIAQELAVLTPSMQDRALLPSCEVVFGALPREVRAAFRKFVPEKGEESGQVFEVAEVLGALD